MKPTGQRILVAEDEPAMRELLEYNLLREGFAVTLCENGEEAGLAIRDTPPDLAVLDWMLPARSGIALCRDIRANPATANLPVIILTARTAIEDRVRGFEYGADDYLSKPFSMVELISRIRALLRRASPRSHSGTITVGEFELNPVTRRVCRGKNAIHLGPKEFGILQILMNQPGRVFSREELLESVWGPGNFVDLRTVDVNITRLRRALGASKKRNPIRTVRLGGYAFDETIAEGA